MATAGRWPQGFAQLRAMLFGGEELLGVSKESTRAGNLVERQPGGPFKLQFVIEAIRSAFPNAGSRDVTILDIGCGAGQFSLSLGQMGYRVHAIDTFAPRIQAGSRIAPANVIFEVRDAYQLAAIGARYKVILCIEIIEHLDAPAKLLRLARDLLEGDGILIVTVPNGYSLIEIVKRFKEAVKKTSIGKKLLTLKRHISPISETALADQHDGDLHKQFFTVSEITRLFREAGFCVKRMQPAGPLYSLLNPLGVVSPQSRFFQRFDRLDSALGKRTPGWIAGGWYFLCSVDSAGKSKSLFADR